MRAVRHLIRALRDDALPVQVAAARALGQLGDPGAVMPLYEIAADVSVDRGLRLIATRSLEQLGFERRQRSSPPGILAWVAGLVLIGGALALSTVIGSLAIVPMLAGMAVILVYYARESRDTGGGWYVGSDGGELYIPGDGGGGGGWFGDVFGGGGGGGGGGNGGGA